MDYLTIKQEPKCEEDIEDFFCEEEIKVCLVYLNTIVTSLRMVFVPTC